MSLTQMNKKKGDVTHALLNLLNSSSQGGNQFVTFNIGEEEYGIPIKSVQEITAFRNLTHLPNTPSFVKGILNLRGSVIPIMDPRTKFGMKEADNLKTSVIIIFKAVDKTIGMIVDRISDVLTIEQKNIEGTPDVSTEINTQFIQGIGKINERFIIILDIEKMFSRDELKFEGAA